jgi:outer membrane receptor for ferrienterochelin and colicins
MMKKTCVFAALLFLATQAQATASSQELAPMVVTSTLTEQSLDVATGTVAVIDQEDIEAMGAEDVADVLMHAAGINVQVGTGRAQEVSIRGLGGDHTLILLDGRRLTGGYNSTVDISTIPIALIDHIEIVRGPGSAIYGSEATGGVVNIITLKPAQKTTGGIDVQAGVGEAAERSLQGMVGSSYGPLRVNVAAAHYEQDGYDNDLNDYGNQELDDTELDTVLSRAAVDLAPGQQLSFGGEWSEYSREGLRYYQNELRNRVGEGGQFGGFVQYDLAGESPFSGMIRAYGNRSEGSYEFDPEADSNENERELAQVEARGTYRFGTTLALTTGGELRYESLAGDEVSDYDDQHKSDRISALYSQFDWSPLVWLNLVGSLRYDDYATSGSHLSPRLVATAFIPYGKLWSSYGQGFHSASLDQLYGEVTKSNGKKIYEGNADLAAETCDSFELGIALRNQWLHGSLVYFHNNIDELIEAELVSTTSGVSTYEYHNVDEAKTYGVELETGVAVNSYIDLAANVTWLQTEDEETGEDLAEEPEWKGQIALSWTLPRYTINGQLCYRFFGTSEDGDGEEIEGYELVSLSLSKRLTDNLRINVGSENLFDEENEYYYQDPLQVYAGLSYRF